MRHMSREGPGAHEAHLGGSSRGLVLDNPGSVVSNARIASVVTWVYGAGFGLATIPVAAFLLRRGRLPVFLGLFQSCGGPWSARVSHATFAVLLMTFLAVNLVAALAAWLLSGGSEAGALIAVALLPVEAVFWVGFALPIPWLLGVARVVLMALAWRSLS
jgi:hypothetical protein